MEKSTFLSGIYKRLDYLANMASSINENDYNTLELELNDLESKIDHLNKKIKDYTPNKTDIAAAKNDDKLILTSKNTELNDYSYQLEKIDNELSKYNLQLSDLVDQENKLTAKKNNLENQINVYKEYSVNSREFKTFIKDNLSSLEVINSELKDITNSQSRMHSAINILAEEKNTIENKMNNIKEDISSLENKLASDKYYSDSMAIIDKKKFVNELTEEVCEYESRVAEIKNSPIYLVQLIKEELDKKGDLNLSLELLKNITDLALEKPYMNITIKNGDATKLEQELNDLNKEYTKKEKNISKTDYSLSKLPIELSRTSSIEQIVNSLDQKIKTHEDVINLNTVAIKVLTNQVAELENEYQTRKVSIDNLTEVYNNSKGTTKEIAYRKREISKMNKELDIAADIINRYKNDIADLIVDNNNEEEIIKNLKSDSKQYSKELSSIIKEQLNRSNYYDIVKQNEDKIELDALKEKIDALEFRLKYKNFNVSALKNEITIGLKKILNSKSLETEAKQLEVSHDSKVQLDDLLDSKKVVSKNEVKESIDSFEQTLKFLYPDNTKEVPVINMEDIVNKELEKERVNDIKDIDLSIDLNKTSTPENIIKVTNVDKVRTGDNEKIKVVDIKKKNTKNLNALDVANLIYNPFDLNNVEENVRKMA